MRSVRKLCIATLLACAPMAASAVFTPFTITGQLTGDPRAANPDGLVVDVTINVTSATSAAWTVDLNSPVAHPNMKLDVFAFNLVAPSSQYSFSNFSPSDWAITTPANNVAGSGGADFMFESNDANGGPSAVTNANPLTFTMTYTGSGDLTAAHFLTAECDELANTAAWCGQMGAHLQSLTAANGQSDSGFAIGNYEEDIPPSQIPEPASLALVGMGLLGMGALRRRRS